MHHALVIAGGPPPWSLMHVSEPVPFPPYVNSFLALYGDVLIRPDWCVLIFVKTVNAFLNVAVVIYLSSWVKRVKFSTD